MKKNHYLLSVLFTVLFTFLWGCVDEKEPEPDIISGINQELLFESKAEPQTITFTTNKKWTATFSTPNSWCAISSVSGGPGVVNINVAVSENSDYSNRTVMLDIKAGDIVKTVTITQKQTDAVIFLKDNYKLPEEGGIFEVDVNTNVELKVIVPAGITWIRRQNSDARALEAKKIIFEVDKNDDTQERQATITFRDEKNTVSSEITVEQTTRNPVRKAHVEKTGTLLEKLGPHYQEITELTLTGIINVSELNTLLYKNNLYYLDLLDVVIMNASAIYNELQGNLFQQGTNLKTVILPNSITSIGHSAFSGCTGLTSITIPNGITTIKNAAFSGCTGLTSFTIPNSVTTIANEAFYRCTGLTAITIPESVVSIGERAFDGCTGFTSLTIPGSVKSIGESAFSSCKSLTSVTLFEGITNIGWGAFSYCTGLTSITIPNSVMTIGEFIFSYCTGLTSVTIGSGIKDTISNLQDFGNCDKLKEIHIKIVVPPTSWWIWAEKDIITLYVPKGSKEAYQYSPYWTGFKEYIEE